MLRTPHPNSPGLEAAVTEAMIRGLVQAFYAKVRRDGVLGPIFNTTIEDWDCHLEKLCAFWSSVTLMTGCYKGRPIEVHARLPNLSDKHFARWLELFRGTARELCPPEAARSFIDRAERISDSLKLGIAIMRGENAAWTGRHSE